MTLGMTLGMTNGTVYGGFADNNIAYCVWTGNYGVAVGNSPSGSTFTGKTYGVTENKEKSGIVTNVGDAIKKLQNQRKAVLLFFTK